MVVRMVDLDGIAKNFAVQLDARRAMAARSDVDGTIVWRGIPFALCQQMRVLWRDKRYESLCEHGPGVFTASAEPAISVRRGCVAQV